MKLSTSPATCTDIAFLYKEKARTGLYSIAASDEGTGWDYNSNAEHSILVQYDSKHPEATLKVAEFVKTISSREKMIVFDKDGTLGDCTDSLRRWAHHMTDRIQRILATADTEEANGIIGKFHARIGWDASTNDVVPSAPLAAGTWTDQVTTVYEFLQDHQDKLHEGTNLTREHAQFWHDELGALHGQDSPLIEDLRALMIKCRNLGYMVAICTSDDRPATDVAMRYWDIHDLVDVSICGNEVTEGKPSAGPLHAVCQLISTKTSLQFLPQHCIVVGDTTSDTGMARNAEAGFCIGVLTGSGTTEQLLGSGAHLVLPDVGHIPALLQSFETLLIEQENAQ